MRVDTIAVIVPSNTAPIVIAQHPKRVLRVRRESPKVMSTIHKIAAVQFEPTMFEKERSESRIFDELCFSACRTTLP